MTTVRPSARWWFTPRMWAVILPASLAAFGCRVSLSPLQNRIAVGEEPIVVFVADGEGRVGDLFAMRAEGGQVYQVTYTRLDESRPALSPDGIQLAFLRARDSSDARVVALNLSNGSERTLFEATPAFTIRGIGWSQDGAALFVATNAQFIRVDVFPAARPASPVGFEDQALADSSTRVLIGEPPFGEIRPCGNPAGPGLCVVLRNGKETLLVAGGRDALRWGRDSVAYFVGNRLAVRPLGRGRSRLVRWESPPLNPRQPTVFLGR